MNEMVKKGDICFDEEFSKEEVRACTIVTNLIHSLLSTKFSVSYRSLQEQSTSLCRKVRDFHSLQFVGTDGVFSEKNIQVKKLPVHILFFYVM